MLRLGIDLGGTKIELIALAGTGKELLRRRMSTPAGDYLATLKTIQTLVMEAERELGQQGSVGIGTPGALSQVTGRIKNSNSVCLNGQPLQQDLEALLQRPVRLSNDANCYYSFGCHGRGRGGKFSGVWRHYRYGYWRRYSDRPQGSDRFQCHRR